MEMQSASRATRLTQLTNRQWLLDNRPEGMITENNFRWTESPIPTPKEGEVLVHNLWLSFDPTQRGWMSADTYVPKIPIGEVMRAAAVGQIVESRRPDYKVGELVRGMFGWQDYTATDGKGITPMRRVPPDVPPTLALSLFGATGLSAYFGMNDIAQSKAGETFVVSGAAGAVGSIAGQIAKIKGSRVIGIAGSKAKCDWLLDEAGFDGAINYRSENVGSRLTELCPKGIDVYFDNVGGPLLDTVLERINHHSRIVLCGAISTYNTKGWPCPVNYLNLMLRRSRMEGFIVLDYVSRYPEAFQALAGWLREGRLKQKEDVILGLENAPRTLMRLFTGENLGKQLLKIADPTPAIE